MARALAGARIFTGETILEGHAAVVEDGRILAVLPQAAAAGLPTRHLDPGCLLAPGFIDVQVNGGGGVLLNDRPDVEAIRAIGAAHRRFGTTGFLPTLITDTRERMTAAIEAVRAARAEGVPGVLGLHLEGPFLNAERKGVHDPALIRAMEEEDVALIAGAAGLGRVLVTLAPEAVPDAVIARLAGAGVIVAAGHTAAGYERVRSALAHGLTGFTHLFNAMTPQTGRAPGVVGAALDDAGSWCGLIADLHHVHPATLRVAIAAKRRGRMMLVTDAMPTVGVDADRFDLLGRTVRRSDGRLTTDDGTLAGSDLDMATAVRNCVDHLGLPVEEALRMASLYPAGFLGLDGELGSIAPGRRADLVLLDAGLSVVETWIGGVSSATGA
ncbi:N-acetylglucosamine-6-phosphate deacetylase [Arenibaculum sp.]|uniref:N-acetylglucosamine-6-phosphate deacetylase n=1 Tax=Arenibaculum sp. TaxID=2865862 RepID=UPI002E152543|nr:N-acetylglucosamine-6-phosphate deacetylase [Arenibaculum sp.]